MAASGNFRGLSTVAAEMARSLFRRQPCLPNSASRRSRRSAYHAELRGPRQIVENALRRGRSRDPYMFPFGTHARPKPSASTHRPLSRTGRFHGYQFYERSGPLSGLLQYLISADGQKPRPATPASAPLVAPYDQTTAGGRDKAG